MTKKHFIAIANMLNEYAADSTLSTLHDQKAFDKLVESMAYLFAQENPLFDSERFFSAVKYYGD
jgi:hypothetical protein